MIIEVTLVRLKRTREPVAIYESVDNIVELGIKIDQIVDPQECEYLDAEMEIDFSLVCRGQFPEFSVREEVQLEAIEAFVPDNEMAFTMLELFTDSSSLWCEMPQGFDYLSSRPDEERFYNDSQPQEEDIF